MSEKQGLTPQSENFSDWYNELVQRAQLAELSPVRGCAVLRPHGYAIWELMQAGLDGMFKETGHENAYFPLFIPKSFFEKEAEHVEGFAKECAIVTHHRLKPNPDGPGLIPDPEAKLTEELIIRPTSETIIWHMYSKWIQSYRDLPILINQWANVVRWEMRTRLFLRSAEFLWQEGHTAHATAEEAKQEAWTMMNVYKRFAEEFMAVPVIAGLKTDNEKFAGAEHSHCIEAMSLDRKAIQAGTSHYLAQNFAKAFDCTFINSEGKPEYVYATSWGVSTRLIGTLIIAHSDDKGLVCPPKLAPVQVVIIPLGKDAAAREKTYGRADEIAKELKGKGFRVKVDKREKESPGYKFNDWELKGACLRIELGPRDLESESCVMARRDSGEKSTVPLANLTETVQTSLDAIQKALFEKALAFRQANTYRIDTWEEFEKHFEGEGGCGFVLAHWDGTTETEKAIAEKLRVTIRVIPETPEIPSDAEPGKCILTGKPSKQRVVFARAY
jgi:prolyl-tRNA synthetase